MDNRTKILTVLLEQEANENQKIYIRKMLKLIESGQNTVGQQILADLASLALGEDLAQDEI